MSGRDEKPERRHASYDLICPHCGEMQWIRGYAQYGIAYYDPRNDIIDYAADPNPELVWEGADWKCDFCDRLAPSDIRDYLNEL